MSENKKEVSIFPNFTLLYSQVCKDALIKDNYYAAALKKIELDQKRGRREKLCESQKILDIIK